MKGIIKAGALLPHRFAAAGEGMVEGEDWIDMAHLSRLFLLLYINPVFAQIDQVHEQLLQAGKPNAFSGSRQF